jgi:hypothetical protein
MDHRTFDSDCSVESSAKHGITVAHNGENVVSWNIVTFPYAVVLAMSMNSVQ